MLSMTPRQLHVFDNLGAIGARRQATSKRIHVELRRFVGRI